MNTHWLQLPRTLHGWFILATVGTSALRVSKYCANTCKQLGKQCEYIYIYIDVYHLHLYLYLYLYLYPYLYLSLSVYIYIYIWYGGFPDIAFGNGAWSGKQHNKYPTNRKHVGVRSNKTYPLASGYASWLVGGVCSPPCFRVIWIGLQFGK